MAAPAAAAANRPPPAHPGPNGGNLHSHANNGTANTTQQDPRLHCISQNPGPSSHPQHPAFARPVFYIQTPPPPPFFHYQWPVPLSYNPFAGFPGMSYGMAMPPFPLPPYMEAPAYVLPQPHIQPVDYRRLLRPQVQVPLYQNPSQSHRIRMPHTVPPRETVNCEVQTEPTQRVIGGEGCPLVGTDSGNATASNSPSSSSLSSEKQSSAEVEDCTLLHCNAKDSQVNKSCTSSTVQHGFNIIHPIGTNAIQSYIRSTHESQRCKDSIGQVPPLVPLSGNGLSNMWSVSSPDSIVPVCSSSREDEIVKERRISVPDILMSWGGCTSQTVLKMADKELTQNTHQLPSYETEAAHVKCVYLSPAETKNVPVVAESIDVNNDAEGILPSTDCEMLKVLRLPCSLFESFSESRQTNEPVDFVGSVSHCLIYGDELHFENPSNRLLDNERENGNDTNPQDDTTETIYQMSLSGCQIKRKMNESVWSVESLAPFIPSKEWLLHNSVFEPKVTEVIEEAENERPLTQNDNLIAKASKERRQTRRVSSSDFVPMSESVLTFSTPAEKPSLLTKPEADNETVSENRGPKHDQNMAPSENNHLPSAIPLQSKNLPTPPEEDRDENGSSELGANESPNQESAIVNEQQEKSPCSPEEETFLLNSAAEEKISFTSQLIRPHGVGMAKENGACVGVSQVRNEELCVPVVDQEMAEVSPSKRHLVDCGIQCTELLELKCQCEPMGSIGPNERHPFKCSDMKKANNGTTEQVFLMNGPVQKNSKRNGQWRNRGHEQHSRQQEAYNGYSGKPGKSKGGTGRNPRY